MFLSPHVGLWRASPETGVHWMLPKLATWAHALGRAVSTRARPDTGLNRHVAKWVVPGPQHACGRTRSSCSGIPICRPLWHGWLASPKGFPQRAGPFKKFRFFCSVLFFSLFFYVYFPLSLFFPFLFCFSFLFPPFYDF